MQSLEHQLSELEQFIPFMENENLEISKVSVAWQIDHSLRVINSISEVLAQSDPNLFKTNFNFLRTLFLTLRFLPRGKGRAPARVLPENDIKELDLRDKLHLAKENAVNFEKLSPNSYFSHPMFGDLQKARAYKFIRIHTEHHLKIIRDILKN